MARQKIHHGAEVEMLTPAEAAALIRTARIEGGQTRMRAAATVKLDGNGNGQDEIYTVPVGFEFEARRLTIDSDVSSDPQAGLVDLSGQPGDVDASQTGAAAAIAAALPGAAGKQTFISGFEVTGSGATAASVIVVTVTGIQGGTKSYVLAIPAGVALGVAPLLVEFSRPLPAAAQNQPITVNVPSFGAGNTNAAVTAHGFQLGGALTTNLQLLRSGTRIEYLAPSSPVGRAQIPGIQTWGREQGPYFRNGETVEVKSVGGNGNAILDVMLEGILRRPTPRS